jgi:hypothetical protein
MIIVPPDAEVSYELVKGIARHVLAIHSVSHTAMSGNAVSKVLQVKCTLEPRSEEPSERRNEGSESGKDKAM